MQNVINQFLEYCQKTSMSYSYKPVLIMALVDHGGELTIQEAVNYFVQYYGNRLSLGLIAERTNSIYSNLNCTLEQISANIKANPVKAVINRSFFVYNRSAEKLSLIPEIRKALTIDTSKKIITVCLQRLDEYYKRISELDDQEFICFHDPDEENGYLSNWYISDFSFRGTCFSSVEQYMMYRKAIMFGDTIIRNRILSTKVSLNKVLVFFDRVSLLEPSMINWNRLHYQRNNKNYEMLLNICYFVLDGMLQTTEKGEYKMAIFSDEHMARLYEKFILEYYRCHHLYLSEARAAQVKWDLSGENDEAMIRFLPVMQTDIFLRHKEKILILDAKYYGKTLQKQFDKYTLHSGNIYQIFTYVKNQDKDNTGNVAGILLYAKTGEDITPDCLFNMGGNQIGAKTLDLNKEFRLIAAQLDAIAEQFFGKQPIASL